jgi:hypothetical protein
LARFQLQLLVVAILVDLSRRYCGCTLGSMSKSWPCDADDVRFPTKRVIRRAIFGRHFNDAPLFAKLTGMAECVEREIARWSVRIDMCEAAGDLPLATGCLADRRFN